MKKIIIALLASLVMFSCEKEMENIGNSIIPGEDLLNVKIESSIVSCLYERDDTIRTRTYSAYLGAFSDNLVGEQKAHIMSRFYLNFSSYKTFIQSDSVKYSLDEAKLNIILDTTKLYGKVKTDISINVYELADILKPEIYNDYYTKGNLPLTILEASNLETVAENQYVYKADDTTSQISIPLKSEFYRKISKLVFGHSFDELPTTTSVTATAKDSIKAIIFDELFEQNPKFVNEFKGLLIKTISGERIVGISDFYISLYYTINESKFVYELRTENPSFLNYKDRDDSLAHIYPLCVFENNTKMSNDNDVNIPNNNRMIIAGGLAYRGNVTFPDLEKWLKNDSVIFNGLTMSIPFNKIDSVSGRKGYEPETLILQCTNNKLEEKYFSQWTGKRNDDKQQYEFLFSKFIYDFKTNHSQNPSSTLSDYEFQIFVPSSHDNLERTQLDCGVGKVKLEIIYTEY
ncbi:MAG: hypothetical protein IPO21_17970 [Bacteroidales bacterium]|nr:hypothetical protein [Bacteroidales bacterium]